MSEPPLVFMSYAHSDDKYEKVRVAEFHECLRHEVFRQFGVPVEIFMDSTGIPCGENWQELLSSSLDVAAVLIAISTPAYFTSEWCGLELARFLEGECRLGRQRVVLPVYYIECDLIEDPERRKGSASAETIAARQLFDWRHLRFEPPTDPNVGRAFAELAKRVAGVLRPEQTPAGDPAPLPADGGEPASTDGSQSAAGSTRQRDAAPQTHVVDWRPGGDHATVGAAIAAARNGDLILVS